MKHYSVGDGDKRITCPDHYLVDGESDETTVVWNPEHPDIPVRVSIITLNPEDPGDRDLAFWRSIEMARENGTDLLIHGKKAIHTYSTPLSEDGYSIHFSEVALGNHFCVFSITTSAGAEETDAFQEIRSDMEGMIESLVERQPEEMFICSLQEREADQIRAAYESFFPDGPSECAWEEFQKQLNRAVRELDRELAERVGMGFGELLRGDAPELEWVVKVDESGRHRALGYANSGIWISPENMILKRMDRADCADLKVLSRDTLERVEKLYRERQQGA